MLNKFGDSMHRFYKKLDFVSLDSRGYLCFGKEVDTAMKVKLPVRWDYEINTRKKEMVVSFYKELKSTRFKRKVKRSMSGPVICCKSAFNDIVDKPTFEEKSVRIPIKKVITSESVVIVDLKPVWRKK